MQPSRNDVRRRVERDNVRMLQAGQAEMFVVVPADDFQGYFATPQRMLPREKDTSLGSAPQLGDQQEFTNGFTSNREMRLLLARHQQSLTAEKQSKLLAPLRE